MLGLLAFVPHPDDESYSFGGTIALAAKAGWDCHVVCASSGEKGKRHDGGPAGVEAVAAARQAELQASCRLLGARPPRFWALPDGALARADRGPTRVSRAIRALRPALVLTLGPDGAYGHPDHVALHRWVVEAWRGLPPGRPPLLFPVFPKALFLPQWEKCRHMLGDPPDPPASAIGGDAWHYDLSVAAVRETKLAAIGAHRTQLPGGDPEALFPEGIVASLLEVERFADASGHRESATAGLLARLLQGAPQG